MKKYFFLFFLFIAISFITIAQPRKGERLPHSGPKPIYIEAHVVPQDTLSMCYVSYRVPYSNLVFVKDGTNYSSGIVFRVEVTGEGGVLARESTHDKVVAAEYEETNKQDKYLEGILSFVLKDTGATVNPLVSLDNTDRQFPLRPFKLPVKEIQPIVVINSSSCSNALGFSLVNYENSIPFDDGDYKLVIPIFGGDLNNVTVIVSQNGKEILSKALTRKMFSQYDIRKCDQQMVLSENMENNTASLFLLDKFSNLLDEGPAEIEVKSSADSVVMSTELMVSWINKPLTLMNPKFAYQLLEVIENEEKLDEIYDKAGGEYDSAITLFWAKYDPDKNTGFNQLMYEFYARADKALKEYSSIGDRFGNLSDRGKVYIKYGEPSEIDRFYSEKNEITEVWKYMSPKAQFVFVDVTGLGNYKLVN